VDFLKNATCIAVVAAVLLALAPGCAQFRRTPQSFAAETYTDLYDEPVAVTIEGYDDDCMEPFITPNGDYLFFNNSNEAKVATHIHIAKRIGKDTFKHIGILDGTLSSKKDMAPSIDDDGNFYFTSTRSYDKDLKSLYVGKLEGERVIGAIPVDGNVWPDRLGNIDMDCSISPNGDMLIISRATFEFGSPGPTKSDLLISRKMNGKFQMDPSSESMLKQVNSPALEYAPALSKDELQLFFTRASEMVINKQSQGIKFRLMVATRLSKSEPFAEPKVIRSINGFVEAPTVTTDCKELYFHKKAKERFRIFRATRLRA
jgi:WD40-like Beta Propeller Repeat